MWVCCAVLCCVVLLGEEEEGRLLCVGAVLCCVIDLTDSNPFHLLVYAGRFEGEKKKHDPSKKLLTHMNINILLPPSSFFFLSVCGAIGGATIQKGFGVQ